MSKVKKIVIYFIFLLFLLPSKVFATNCDFSFAPPTPNQNMNGLVVTVKSNELVSGKYKMILTTPNSAGVKSAKDMDFSGGSGSVEFPKFTGTGWLAGNYTVGLILPNQPQQQNSAICNKSFPIDETPSQTSCTLSIPTKPINPDTDVTLKIENLKTSNKGTPDLGDGGYDIYINDQQKFIYSSSDGTDFNLGKFPTGTYTVKVKNRCGFGGAGCMDKPAQLQCPIVVFFSATRGSAEGGQINPEEAAKLKPGCSSEDFRTGKCTTSEGDQRCSLPDRPAINTAIGCVPTKPLEFIQTGFKFILAISGGLAFLMMLLGAFRMLTSAGNPETLQGGRDRFQSAIIGLLFVIFAVLLLQIIGFDILKLPGFGR